MLFDDFIGQVCSFSVDIPNIDSRLIGTAILHFCILCYLLP